MEGLPLTSLDMNPALRHAARSNVVAKPRQDNAELERVAKEFESVFVSMLVKEMRNTLEDGFFSSESSDVLGGMFDQYLGQHLAESSPIGIHELLMSQKFAGGITDSDSDGSNTDPSDSGNGMGSTPMTTETSTGETGS